MSSELKNAEDDLPRDRTIRRVPDSDGGFFEQLDHRPWFKPAVLFSAAIIIGFMLAPQWAGRNYPTDPALLNQPAQGDIKAEYDDHGDIIDERTTERLRDEAEAKARRVYEFDVLLGKNTAERVNAAFAPIQEKVQAAKISIPGPSADQAQPKRAGGATIGPQRNLRYGTHHPAKRLGPAPWKIEMPQPWPVWNTTITLPTS